MLGLYGFNEIRFNGLDKYNNSNDGEFFYDLIKCIKNEDKEYIDDIIYFIDKYIQHDIIKIVRVEK